MKTLINLLARLFNTNNLSVSIINKIKFYYYRFQFKSIGYGSIINHNISITNKKNIVIGKNVIIFSNCRIELIEKYEEELFKPQLSIDDYSQIHQNCHITCAERISIGKNVVIVSNVTITDITHPHQDIDIPINKAKLKTLPVSIDDEVYVYNNVVILPGVSIGKHSIIGANSVVNESVPSYSIAVGNPAKVIKRYNFATSTWERV